MTIAFTGSNGMLAHAFKKILKDRKDIKAIFYSKDELDIVNKESVDDFFRQNDFQVLINCAAYTKVDQAESEPQIANEINGYAVGYLAERCEERNILFITYSTDYVFDGENKDGYSEEDPTNPLNAYGKSKEIGEEMTQINADKYYIIRTQWLYGPHGKNFVDTIVNAYNEGKDLKVVNDQFGSPTFTIDLAEQTIKLIDKSQDYDFGIYHFTNEGICSWHEFAEFFLSQKFNKEIKVTSVDSNEFPRPAKRPHYSKLNNQKFSPMRNWKDAVKDYLENY